MSNAVRFLETLGSGGGYTAADDYAEAVDALAISDAERQALRRRDAAALSRALGARDNVMLFLFPAEDVPSEGDGEGTQPAPEQPSQQPAEPAAD